MPRDTQLKICVDCRYGLLVRSFVESFTRCPLWDRSHARPVGNQQIHNCRMGNNSQFDHLEWAIRVFTPRICLAENYNSPASPSIMYAAFKITYRSEMAKKIKGQKIEMSNGTLNGRTIATDEQRNGDVVGSCQSNNEIKWHSRVCFWWAPRYWCGQTLEYPPRSAQPRRRSNNKIHIGIGNDIAL